MKAALGHGGKRAEDADLCVGFALLFCIHADQEVARITEGA